MQILVAPEGYSFGLVNEVAEGDEVCTCAELCLGDIEDVFSQGPSSLGKRAVQRDEETFAGEALDDSAKRVLELTMPESYEASACKVSGSGTWWTTIRARATVPVAVNEDAENCMERLPGKRSTDYIISYEVLWGDHTGWRGYGYGKVIPVEIQICRITGWQETLSRRHAPMSPRDLPRWSA